MVFGIPSAYNQDILGLFDAIAGEFLLAVGAFFLAIFVGYRMANPREEVRKGFNHEGLIDVWYWLVRVLAPIILLVVIWDRGRNVISMIRGMFGG